MLIDIFFPSDCLFSIRYWNKKIRVKKLDFQVHGSRMEKKKGSRVRGVKGSSGGKKKG
jgi:hypothetical protein